jgi:hypothetical protein
LIGLGGHATGKFEDLVEKPTRASSPLLAPEQPTPSRSQVVEARRIRLAFLLPLSREVVVALEVGACNWRRSGRRSWTRREEGLWHTERIILLFWYTRLLKRREGFPVAIQYREGRLERGYKGLISGLLSLACAGMVASRSGATCVRRRRREGTNTLFYILVSKFPDSPLSVQRNVV